MSHFHLRPRNVQRKPKPLEFRSDARSVFPRHCRAKALAAWVVGSTVAASAAAQGSFGRTEAELTGRTDANTPIANATVWVGGCSGALIRPDIVITAGHCVARPTGHRDVPGRWEPVSWLADRRVLDIRIGNNRTSPLLTVAATHITVLPGADIALLALDRPVPATAARPVRVLTVLPSGLSLQTKRFRQSGWGATSPASSSQPTLRQTANATFGAWPCEVTASRPDGTAERLLSLNKLCVTGGLVLPGDSGGPLYMTESTGAEILVGVAQGTESGGGRYVPTWLRGGTSRFLDSGQTVLEPDVGAFIESHLRDSGCGQVRAMGNEGGPTKLLVTWHDARRGDYFSTTATSWMGCSGDRRSPGYGFDRVEARIFAPDRPQPRGTVPMHAWYSRDREDNWTTTLHAVEGSAGRGLSPGYRFARLEGYVYPPTAPQPPGTVALHAWFNSHLGDNKVTSDPTWRPGADGTFFGYRHLGVIGYGLRAEPPMAVPGPGTIDPPDLPQQTPAGRIPE